MGLLLSALVVIASSYTYKKNHTIPVVGELEWERVELVNEISEPIIERPAAEGDYLQAGDIILILDPRRARAILQSTIATRNQLAAKLKELSTGSRKEDIEQAKQLVIKSQSLLSLARLEYSRIQKLHQQQYLSQDDLDKAKNAVATAQSTLAFDQANLLKLQSGTRIEILEQAKQALQAADSQVKHNEINLQRLQIHAPRAGILDSLPFEIGEQPQAGSVVAVMLAGNQPYARIHIPEQMRVAVKPGTRAKIQIDGVDQVFDAKVRSIQYSPDFTPYYALTEADRSRLSYLAKLDFVDAEVRLLPAGLPLTVTFDLDTMNTIAE